MSLIYKEITSRRIFRLSQWNKDNECSVGAFRLIVVFVFGSGCAGGAVADDKQISEQRHLGVASCASSVCHGKLARQDDHRVWLNEYRIWSGAGKHSLGYRILQNAESRRIANYLGLASATTAEVCLDCHADNVPAEKRGSKFQISDGVGCEACHGGAEAWVESHAVESATHAENLSRGMYPTESPIARAKLCLSCHMGADDRFAGHDIYGAGHPRLSFELETFTASQPPHFEVDDDYRARKGNIPGFNLWLTGQLESARRFLDLVRQRIGSTPGPYPELALYDCHGCHHAIDDKRWTPARGGAGVRPGSPRLQDQHLLILQSAVSVLESSDVLSVLTSTTEAFVRAGQQDVEAVRSTAGVLMDWLTDRQLDWASREFDRDTVIAVRRALIDTAARGQMSDFHAAEQVYLGLESLSYSLGDRQTVEAALDQIYAEVEDDSSFNPSTFATTARNLRGKF